MKVLFINQFFPPDLAPTGQLLSDVTSYLSKQGHEVSVICSESVYAEGGQAYQGSETVYRLRGLRFRRSLVGRSASYLAFLFEALRVALQIREIDLVVTLTTPPLLQMVGALVKRLRHCQFYAWQMDLFPESLVTMGLLPSRSIVTRLLRKAAHFPLRKADGIIVLGCCMRDALIAYGIPASLIRVAENWSRPAPSVSAPPTNPWITILYSGNLGASHEIETISAAMAVLAHDARFRFVFAGGGVKRRLLESQCRELGLTQVQFMPYGNDSEYASRVQYADIGLVTQTDSSLGAVVPSKLYNTLAFGRPVLFVGPAASTAALVIQSNSCGWHVACGASAQLVTLLKHLASNRAAIATAARNARFTYIKQYTVDSGTDRIGVALGLPAFVKAKTMRAGS